jgi:hypothetical protein
MKAGFVDLPRVRRALEALDALVRRFRGSQRQGRGAGSRWCWTRERMQATVEEMAGKK